MHDPELRKFRELGISWPATIAKEQMAAQAKVIL